MGPTQCLKLMGQQHGPVKGETGLCYSCQTPGLRRLKKVRHGFGFTFVVSKSSSFGFSFSFKIQSKLGLSFGFVTLGFVPLSGKEVFLDDGDRNNRNLHGKEVKMLSKFKHAYPRWYMYQLCEPPRNINLSLDHLNSHTSNPDICKDHCTDYVG